MTYTKVPRFSAKRPRRFSRHPEQGYVLRGRVWLEKDGELYIGGGRLMLLERIDEFGSIAGAARSMKLGYRNAWLWVEAMNRLAPTSLVIKRPGGNKGGSSVLTKEGREIVASYKELRTKLQELLKVWGDSMKI